MSMGVCVCVQNYSNFEKTFAIEQKNNNKTYCVRNVNAALVIDDGKLKPFVISRQIFLFITSTKPPRATTN